MRDGRAQREDSISLSYFSIQLASPDFIFRQVLSIGAGAGAGTRGGRGCNIAPDSSKLARALEFIIAAKER